MEAIINTQRRSLGLVVSVTLLLMLLSLALASCAPRQTTLTVAGSRSVTPIVEILAEAYEARHPGISVNIQGGGSTAGIQAAQGGVADIGMSSRLLTEDEKKVLVPNIIAYDAVAVIVHPQNKLENVTFDQLQKVFAGEIADWKELGGDAHPITLIDKEAGSGTKAVFEEVVMKESKMASSAVVMDGTGAARTAVAGNPSAIGYISAASVTPEVKAILVNGIAADIAQVQSGNYKIVQPFLLVTKGQPNGLGKDFIDFVFGSEGHTLITNNSLIPAQ